MFSAKAVRQHRRSLDLKQEALAQRRCASHLRKFEYGDLSPSQLIAERLVMALIARSRDGVNGQQSRQPLAEKRRTSFICCTTSKPLRPAYGTHSAPFCATTLKDLIIY
jgi:hypothetical protein